MSEKTKSEQKATILRGVGKDICSIVIDMTAGAGMSEIIGYAVSAVCPTPVKVSAKILRVAGVAGFTMIAKSQLDKATEPILDHIFNVNSKDYEEAVDELKADAISDLGNTKIEIV